MELAGKGTQTKLLSGGAGRRRRSTTEVRSLILASARAMFAADGLAGTTTRNVAQGAGVAEALIFRHFESKANLFEAAIIEPFKAVFTAFLESMDVEEKGKKARSLYTMQALFLFLRENADLLQALAKSSVAGDLPLSHALDDYFLAAEKRVRLLYRDREGDYDIPPAIFVRYSFGMVAAAVLFEGWFFPDAPIDDDMAAAILARMSYKAIQPAEEN